MRFTLRTIANIFQPGPFKRPVIEDIDHPNQYNEPPACIHIANIRDILDRNSGSANRNNPVLFLFPSTDPDHDHV